MKLYILTRYKTHPLILGFSKHQHRLQASLSVSLGLHHGVNMSHNLIHQRLVQLLCLLTNALKSVCQLILDSTHVTLALSRLDWAVKTEPCCVDLLAISASKAEMAALVIDVWIWSCYCQLNRHVNSRSSPLPPSRVRYYIAVDDLQPLPFAVLRLDPVAHACLPER